jgi:hypothetical protein
LVTVCVWQSEERGRGEERRAEAGNGGEAPNPQSPAERGPLAAKHRRRRRGRREQ